MENNIQKFLFDNQDLKYKSFTEKLIPNISKDTIIGVRIPIIRKYVKENKVDKLFLKDLPHKYFEENQIHSIIISNIQDYETTINYVNEYLPYINNWATTDILSPKVFAKNKDNLLVEIKKWIKSDEEYTIRFGISMLMQHYLKDNFKMEYIDLVVNTKSEKYYINMMRAWYFQNAILFQYDNAVKYLENRSLDKWTHNKAIQKCIESRKIDNSKKEYLKKLKY